MALWFRYDFCGGLVETDMQFDFVVFNFPHTGTDAGLQVTLLGTFRERLGTFCERLGTFCGRLGTFCERLGTFCEQSGAAPR